MVATEVWPLRTVQARTSNGPVEVEVNWTASGAVPFVGSMVNAATIGVITGGLKSQTRSAKSILPLPLKSNAVNGSFAAIQVIWLKNRTMSAKSARPLPFTSSYSPSPFVSVGAAGPPGTVSTGRAVGVTV